MPLSDIAGLTCKGYSIIHSMNPGTEEYASSFVPIVKTYLTGATSKNPLCPGAIVPDGIIHVTGSKDNIYELTIQKIKEIEDDRRKEDDTS